MKVKELLEVWLEASRDRQLKVRTYARYREIVRLHIAPLLGECDIKEMTRRQINEFLVQMRTSGNTNGGGLSNASVNLMLTVLRLAFEYACDMELMEWNPCERIRRATADASSRRAEAYTREEQRRLEKAIEEGKDERLVGVLLCLYTGLRIGELIGLEWGDLKENCRVLSVSRTVYRGQNDGGDWQLYVDVPKTHSSAREIPLPPHLIEVLKAQRRASNSKYIISNKFGERMSVRSYQYIFEQLTIAAGVRRLNFHALRHTFATRALECGMDIKTLSEIMGHKTATITLNRYAHSMMDTKIKMMRKMVRIG